MHETLTLDPLVREDIVEMKKGFLGYIVLGVNQETKVIYVKEKCKDFLNKESLLEKFFKPKEAAIFIFNWADSKEHLHYVWSINWVPEDCSEKEKHFFHFANKNQDLHKIIGADHQSNHTTLETVTKVLSK